MSSPVEVVKDSPGLDVEAEISSCSNSAAQGACGF